MNNNLQKIYNVLSDIAGATRSKLAESDKYTLQEIPEKIKSIKSGGSSSLLWSSFMYPSKFIIQDWKNNSKHFNTPVIILSKMELKNVVKFSNYNIMSNSYKQIDVDPIIK